MISYGELRAAVGGDGVGLRARITLEPLGGAGDKVFPPTYAAAERAETRYAIERRVTAVGEEPVDAVVLDSVASQANRFELALLEAVREGTGVPITSVDFRPFEDLAFLGRISDYEAPHRIFDALLRDSLLDGEWFRGSEPGRAITEASPTNAAALYRHSPHTLVFGAWDSTGPRGGLGAKYERAITSEIVALKIAAGAKTASRLDPAGIEREAAVVYQAADGGWTLDENEAAKDKGKPVVLRPSEVNHGNVAPSIDRTAGGVTAESIVATTVLSFIQLRRLRFPVAADGSALADRAEAEVAARTALAAVGLASAALAFEAGFDLRSRCVLVSQSDLEFELVSRSGQRASFGVTAAEALDLVHRSAERAAAAGMAWRDGELLLQPSERLVELIRRSHDRGRRVDSGAEA